MPALVPRQSMGPRSIGLDLYVRPVPGKKNRWWFRRRVPGDLVSIIGHTEWRYWLEARNEVDARREGIPYLDETDQIIRLARTGDWPALTEEQVEAIAVGWWVEFGETVFSRIQKSGHPDAGWVNTDPRVWALPNEEELERSISRYIAGPRSLEYVFSPEREIIIELLDDPKRATAIRTNKTAMKQILDECRGTHHAVAKRYADTWRQKDRAAEQVLDVIYNGGKTSPANDTETVATVAVHPILAVVRPIRFNDPDDEQNDLIGQWARLGSPKRTKLPGTKTVYEARRMMRKLTAFVGFDDLRQLTRKHVRDWVDDLKQTKVKSGKPLASMTVSQHLLQLKALCNFAVDREIITVNPAEKVKYVAQAGTKIRAFTDAEARAVLEAARREKIAHKRWLPWVCCFTGARLDEVAGAAVADVEQIGSYWVLNIRLDNRHEGASIKNASSVRKVPLHQALIDEGFFRDHMDRLPKDGALFPMLKPDKFGSKGGNATKRIGSMIRALAKEMPSLGDRNISPSHSWRHRLHNQFRSLEIRVDTENAITGHAQEGEGPGYGEYAIMEVLGPAMDRTRSPFEAP
jgi:Phage integrase SAM-like domain